MEGKLVELRLEQFEQERDTLEIAKDITKMQIMEDPIELDTLNEDQLMGLATISLAKEREIILKN